MCGVTSPFACGLQGPGGWEDVLQPRQLHGRCNAEGCRCSDAVSMDLGPCVQYKSLIPVSYTFRLFTSSVLATRLKWVLRKSVWH